MARDGELREGDEERRDDPSVRAEQVQDRERPRGPQAIGHIFGDLQPPVWLNGDGVTTFSAGEIVPLINGSCTSQGASLRRTPRPCSSITFCRSPTTLRLHRLSAVSLPVRVVGDDEESKNALGEWFGYVLSNRDRSTEVLSAGRAQRSGKGTIARALTGLLGMHNTAAPTLAGLTQNFGLQPLIGKPLAVVSNARLAARSDNISPSSGSLDFW